MLRTGMRIALIGLFGGGLIGRSPAAEPPPAAIAERPDAALLRALAENPATAPYRFVVSSRGGRLSLSGRVGTKQIHDIAVRTAIAGGFRFDDALVIDTAEVYRAAAASMPPPYLPIGGIGNGYGASQVTGTLPAPPPFYGPSAAGPPFLYPPPLFGRYDDPFWGFEPPLITYPPWWGAMSAQRLGQDAPPPLAPQTQIRPPYRSQSAPPAAENRQAQGAVTVDIDPLGVAKLTGVVATEAERLAVQQKVAMSPEVTDVINNLTVAPAASPAVPALRNPDTPPPPPVPAGEPEVIAPGAITVDADDLSQRLMQALSRRPDLAELPIRATLRGGVATLSGKVPSAYEAMVAFRAAQQMTGVRSVDDRLEFTVPDGQHRNPLLKKGRPEDVEPYLEAQIRRQVGDQAHIDRVRVMGDTLEVRGTVPDDQARPRVEAILRSIPLLRGFDLKPVLSLE